MAVKLNSELAAFFNTGDQPSETEFGHLIDTFLPIPVLLSSGTQTLTKVANQGRVNIVPNLGGASVYTIPVPAAAGEWYKFIYGGAAEDAEMVQFSTGTGNAVYMKGAIIHHDTGGNSAAAYSNGSSNELLKLDNAGPYEINFLSYSTTIWYVWGNTTSADNTLFAD